MGVRVTRPVEFVKDHLGVVISMAVGLLVGTLAVAFMWYRGGVEVPPWLLALVLVGGVVVVIAAAALALAVGKTLVGDRVEVAVRVPGDKKWRHGRLTVIPGGLRLEPYRWQVRVPTGEQIDLRDVELGEDVGRRPPLRQMWSINPALHVIRLGSDQGELELGVLPAHLARLRGQMHLSGSGQPPSRA